MRRRLLSACFWLPFGALTFAGSCAVSSYSVLRIAEARMKKPVGTPVPEMFPVLGATRDTEGRLVAHPLRYSELATFTARHPGAVFRIAAEDAEALRESLRRVRGADFVTGPPDGAQRVEFTYPNENMVYKGYYEALGNEIRPTHLVSYFNAGLAVAVILPILGLTFVMWAGFVLLCRKLERLLLL